MMAAGHQATAANMALALATVGLVTPGQAAALGVGALVTAAGPFSPDADNRKPLRRWLEHRETLHGWGWPVLAGVALAMAGAPLAAYGPVIGWASHLVPADLIFGKGGQHIPRGLPTAPFGVLRLRKPKSRRKRSERWGVGLRVSADNTRLSLALVGRREHSVLELAATVLLVVALAGQAWLLLGR